MFIVSIAEYRKLLN